MPLLLQAVAFWPVWRWYAARVTDSSDDAWGWVAIIAAAAMIASRRQEQQSITDSAPTLLLPAALTLCYAVTFPFITPLPRALLAMTAIGATLSIYCFRSKFQLSFCGLLLLSLPVMASLQFYLGYPLRTAVTAISATLLQLVGLAVIREGTGLNWNGQLISVDAPCSGVKMLWTGMFLTFALACWFRLDTKRTIAMVALSFITILLGNTMRAMALFYPEAGIIKLPDDYSGPAHSAIGVMIFLLTAIAIAWIVTRMKVVTSAGKRSCEHLPVSSPAAR